MPDDDEDNPFLGLLREARRCVAEARRAGANPARARLRVLDAFDRHVEARPAEEDWPYLRTLIERAMADELYQHEVISGK